MNRWKIPKFLSGPIGLLFLAALLLMQPKPAQAVAISATLCNVQAFPCPFGQVMDSGLRVGGVNTLLPGQYSVLPFLFSDLFVTFNGTIVVADLGGQYIYEWGQGTATSNIGGVSLDIMISQNFVTLPGLWAFGEMNSYACAPAAPNSYSSVVGTVNGSAMLVLPGPCGAGGGTFFSGPYFKNVGLVTNMTALAQIYFDVPGTITLPWGADFPDPGLSFAPNPDDFLNNLQAFPGLSQVNTPEPGTWSMLGGALIGLGVWGRKRTKK